MKMMRKLSGKGDEVVAEWDTTTAPEKMQEIGDEFNKLMKSGFFAADLRNSEVIHEFNPEADILIIPRMVGG